MNRGLVKSVLIGALGACVPGCSLRVADHEWTMGYCAERPGLERRVTPGLDFRFGGAWPGINAGLNATTLAAPAGPAGHPDVSHATGFLTPLGWSWTNAGAVRQLGWFHRKSSAPIGDVRLIGDSWFGAAGSWHPASSGVGLGFSRQTMVLFPTNISGTFLIDFNSRRPLAGGIVRLPTNTTDRPVP